jgi:hypothetical protein
MYRIKQDDEIGFPPRPTTGLGNPMVFRMEEHHYVTLTKEWQELWFGLNRSGDWSADHKAWLAYTESSRAFTNNNGIYDWSVSDEQLRADYIGGTGLDLPDPKMATLICGRNVLCGVEMVLPFRVGYYPAGTQVLKVETIRDPSIKVTRETHPHLVHVANIILEQLAPNGLRIVNAFPQRGGRDGYPVYYPVISNRDVYYRLDQLEKLPLGSPLPPYYNPP